MIAAERPGRLLLRWAAVWLLALAALGLYMRLGTLFSLPTFGGFGNLVHAHSHTAYFGWAGLGVMGLMLELLPGLTGRPDLAAPRAAALLVRVTPWTVGGAMAAYAVQGYGAVSIALATGNGLLWYAFAYAFCAQVRGLPLRRWPPALLLFGAAVLYLLVASLGTWLVSALMALQVTDPLWRNAGVYLFLHAYSDGWLELGVAGGAAVLLPRILGAPLDRPQWLRWQALLAALLVLPSFLRLLVPHGLSGLPATLGAAAGLLLVLPEGLLLAATRRAWRGADPARRAAPGAAWLVAAWWGLAAKLLTELVPLVPGWEQLAVSRQALMAYLHLKLLGFFTPALLGLAAHLFQARQPARCVAVYQAGTAGLVLTLAAVALVAPQAPGWVRPLMAGALAFNLLPALGLAPLAGQVAAGLWRRRVPAAAPGGRGAFTPGR